MISLFFESTIVYLDIEITGMSCVAVWMIRIIPVGA
jgi:hypothetical protein